MLTPPMLDNKELLHRRFSHRRLCCARRGVKRISQPFKCRLCVCWIPTETLCAPFARREKRNRLRVGLATTRNWTLSHLPGERWGLLAASWEPHSRYSWLNNCSPEHADCWKVSRRQFTLCFRDRRHTMFSLTVPSAMKGRVNTTRRLLN